jgi:hypothetical protein
MFPLGTGSTPTAMGAVAGVIGARSVVRVRDVVEPWWRTYAPPFVKTLLDTSSINGSFPVLLHVFFFNLSFILQ